MGWSCRQEQSDTLGRIHDAELRQTGYAKQDGKDYVFVDGPHGGPYGRDYGTPPHNHICLATYHVGKDGLARRIGYTKISPEGKILSMPRLARKALLIERDRHVSMV